jgi:hypothetical protein
MIGESSGVTTLLNNERIQRENQISPESKAPPQGEDVAAANFSDVTSFSAEALALSQKVLPAGGNPEQDQVEQQDTGREKSREYPPGFLDIRA